MSFADWIKGKAAWGLAGHAADHGAMGVRSALPAPNPPGSTCYLFAYPGTGSTPRNGERQIHVPIDGGAYFTAHYSDKNMSSYSVPHLTELAISRPALHVLAASLTKTGSWTSTTNAASFHNAYAYSVTSGDTISGSVSGPEVWAQLFWSTNGGYAVVAIDGDYTRANRLPKVTQADVDAGLFRAGDVGKAYVCCYAGVSNDDAVILADNLAAGAHTVTIEATGTKPSASSAARVYVESFAGTTASVPPTADVHFCPLYYIAHGKDSSYSALEWVPKFAPSGSSDYQSIGSVYANNASSKETSVSLSILVDGVDKSSLAAGSYATGALIYIAQVSDVAHKANLATVVLRKTRTYSAMTGRPLPVMCKVDAAWQAAGTINYSYPVMLPLGYFEPASRIVKQDLFTQIGIGSRTLSAPAAHNNTTYAAGSELRRIMAIGAKVQAWADLVASAPDLSALYAGGGTVTAVDRSDGILKGYVVDCGGVIVPVASEQTASYVMGWGGRLVT